MARSIICPECLEATEGEEPPRYKVCKDCRRRADDIESSVIEDSISRAVNDFLELREEDGEDPNY
jgi:tRNA(Ile2) C34 agmatinyltransferase TiaS